MIAAGTGLAVLAGGICFLRTIRAGRAACRGTSLIAAWRWLLVAELAVLGMAASDLCCRLWSEQSADYGWCLASIVLLCPPMAVLGARRPGVRVWSWFILLPMMLVLSWPVWTIALQGGEWRGLALELPTVLGFGFVLMMSVSNYLGTTSSSRALAYLSGTAVLFATCTGWTLVAGEHRASLRLTGGLLLLAAGWLRPSPDPPLRNPVNLVWRDFRNLFGSVWALRMVERINAYAAQEHWSIRLNYDGFPETETGELTADEAQVRAATHWLLRRFVDDAWVQERLARTGDVPRNGQT